MSESMIGQWNDDWDWPHEQQRAWAGPASMIERMARAILERRTRPDWTLVVDGSWTIDHDKELARAVLAAQSHERQQMSESMIERMARAVYAGNQWKRWVEETQTWYHIPWEELADSERDERLTDQRNAIAGIESAGYAIVPREPTEAMLEYAASRLSDNPDWDKIWLAMIDSAAKETP